MLIITIIGVSFGFASLIATIYTIIKLSRTRRRHKKDTWSLYRDASTIFGGLQRFSQNISTAQTNQIELGRLISHAEHMMNNQIKEICHNEKVTTNKIDEWINVQKICDSSHKDLFIKYTDE